MRKFYEIKPLQIPYGTAVEIKDPPIQGQILCSVSNSSSADLTKIIVCDCTDEQHTANLSTFGTREISLDDAQEMSARFKPARKVPHFNPEKQQEEEIERPAFDLKARLASMAGSEGIGTSMLAEGKKKNRKKTDDIILPGIGDTLLKKERKK
jgi:hypothetical protein